MKTKIQFKKRKIEEIEKELHKTEKLKKNRKAKSMNQKKNNERNNKNRNNTKKINGLNETINISQKEK